MFVSEIFISQFCLLLFLERFNETMVNAYSLYVLSICHVCGSYQCPYCPIFSSTVISMVNLPLFVVLIITSIFHYTGRRWITDF